MPRFFSLQFFLHVAIVSFYTHEVLAQTAEEWVTQIGSFETGLFTPSGTVTDLTNDYKAAPMDGWNQSFTGYGDFATNIPGAWAYDPARAQHGGYYVMLDSYSQFFLNNDPPSAHLNGGSLLLKFGSLSDGSTEPDLLYGPALAANTTYELSFWVKDFGVNSTRNSLSLFFMDHNDTDVTYVEGFIPSPLRATDGNGNALPYDPDDPAVSWQQHVFTFETTDGNGTLGIAIHAQASSYNGELTNQTVYLDNFQLVAVPEPSGLLLVGATLMGAMLRRSRQPALNRKHP